MLFLYATTLPNPAPPTPERPPWCISVTGSAAVASACAKEEESTWIAAYRVWQGVEAFRSMWFQFAEGVAVIGAIVLSTGRKPSLPNPKVRFPLRRVLLAGSVACAAVVVLLVEANAAYAYGEGPKALVYVDWLFALTHRSNLNNLGVMTAAFTLAGSVCFLCWKAKTGVRSAVVEAATLYAVPLLLLNSVLIFMFDRVEMSLQITYFLRGLHFSRVELVSNWTALVVSAFIVARFSIPWKRIAAGDAPSAPSV